MTGSGEELDLSSSVIIPTYGRSEMLSDAVDSVLRQSSTCEIVVVDDGSPVPVELPPHPQVKLIRQENRGPAAARNTGIAHATGEIIFFLDDDDCFRPGRILSALRLHQSFDVVVCGSRWMDSERGSNVVRRSARTTRDVLRPMTPHLGTTSIRRDRCPLFRQALVASQDVDWWLRLGSLALPIGVVPSDDYLVRRHSGVRGLNSSAARLEAGYEILRLNSDVLREMRALRADRTSRVARMHLATGDVLGARRLARRAALTLPTRLAVSTFLLSHRLKVTAPPPPPLAPLSPARARSFSPHSEGPLEAQVFQAGGARSWMGRVSEGIPKPLRGYLREAVFRLPRLRRGYRSVWAELPVDVGDRRYNRNYVNEPLETALIARLLSEGDVMVDVGANRGWYTACAAVRVQGTGRVLAVEPDPRMFPLLKRMVEVNDFGHVELFNGAIAGTEGEASFVLAPDAAKSHLADDAEGAVHDSVSVRTTPLSTLLRSVGIDHVDVLKIDTEGAELAVLRSADLAAIGRPSVLVETHLAAHDRNGLLQLVEHFGQQDYQVFFVAYRSSSPLVEIGGDFDAGGLVGWNSLALPSERAEPVLKRLILTVD